MSIVDIYDSYLTISGHQITWREIVGNAFGIGSALGGMRRKIWAWPVGIVGNALLFTVFFAVGFTGHGGQVLFGQAGRQVFFILTSIYGWWAWRQTKATRSSDAPAVDPRWATSLERSAYVAAWGAGVVLCWWIFALIGAGFPAPWWYYWADAWIFVGSMMATYAMARGWTDFWLMWLAVDLVGVPELIKFQYYPSAVLYAVYAGFVIWGFFVWLKVSRRSDVLVPEPVGSI